MAIRDVADKAIQANDTQQGTIITQPAKNGSLTNRKYTGQTKIGPDVLRLDAQYTNRFDDVGYYSA